MRNVSYKGVNALLMREGAKDFRTGQSFSHTLFFDENVDIHHIFPKEWCRRRGIEPRRYDSIINKTPLTARTNRIIGDLAPSDYLAKMIGPDTLVDDAAVDRRLESHHIDPALLRNDDFDNFFDARQAALVALIEGATGKSVVPEVLDEVEEYDDLDDDDAVA